MTNESEIRQIIRSAVLPSDDMFDMKLREGCVILGKLAIFAGVSRPSANDFPSRLVHAASLSRWTSFREGISETLKRGSDPKFLASTGWQL